MPIARILITIIIYTGTALLFISIKDIIASPVNIIRLPIYPLWIMNVYIFCNIPFLLFFLFSL